MNIFKFLSACVSACYSTARIVFAVIELAFDTADWFIGRMEKWWNNAKWNSLNVLARVVFTPRELK